MSAADTTIGSALVLRSFALCLLGRATPAPSLHAAAAACAPDAWRLFLQSESCASPLLRRLHALALLDTLTLDARAVLQQAVAIETQRVLAARTQLHAIDAIAARLDVTPVILKGGGHLAAGGEPLDLGDLDVLVPGDRADAFADALRALGYERVVGIADNDVEANHLPALVPPGGIVVEVHRQVRYGDDLLDETDETRPIAGYRTLRHAVGPRTLASLLHHATALHPHRFGHLRDLVLIAAQARALSPDERRAATTRIADAPDGRDLHTMLAQAEAIDGGVSIDDPPACRLVAARKYAIVTGEDATLRDRFVALNDLAYLGFESTTRRRSRIRTYLVGRLPQNSRWFPHRLGRVSPRAADVTGRAARMLPRLAILASAVAIAPRALARAQRRVRLADACLTMMPNVVKSSS